MSHDTGYGKPPKASRFQKGQSGNPAGRPKGRHSIQSLFARHLGKRIPAKINGKSMTMEQREAIVVRVIEMAKSGDPNAIRIAMAADNAVAGSHAAREPLLTQGQQEAIMANLGLTRPKGRKK